MKRFLYLLIFLVASSFVIVIPSYNNSKYVEKNLTSVFSQKGNNWRAIYIDDCSTDSTYEMAKNLIAKSGLQERFTLIKNEKRCGALENLYRAIHSCPDDEVVLTVDGDDWLPNDRVIEYLTKVYAEPYVWMTYGSYQRYPKGIRGTSSAPIPEEILINQSLRKYRFCTSHLRTFYAGLFKKIKLEDLLYEGKCYPMAWDQAMMFPMLEMSMTQGIDHFKYLDEILYVYNQENPINDSKVSKKLMWACEKSIRGLPSYASLPPPLLKSESEKNLQPQVIVFSYDRPLQLYAFLESLFKYGSGVGQVTAIYRVSGPHYESAYRKVTASFPSVTFLKQSQNPAADFKPLLLTVLNDPSDYVAFAVDDIIVKDVFDFRECAAALEETGAYGFYLRLAPHVDYCYSLNKDQLAPYLTNVNASKKIFAWQFKYGVGDWAYCNTVDLTVYKKETILEELTRLSYVNPNSLEAHWAYRADPMRLGLCYETSKMVNIPLNIVNASENRHMNAYTPEQLLQKFNEGWRLDISPLYQMKNHSAHIEFDPSFIKD